MSPKGKPNTNAGSGANIPASPNFAFLTEHDPLLVLYAAQAERYVFDDPNTALIKLRQFAEVLANQAAAHAGVYDEETTNLSDVLNQLWNRGMVNAEVSQLFHGLRKAGNAAAHENAGTCREALHQLRMARQLAVWFHRTTTVGADFKAGPFVPPPDPAHVEQSLKEELEQARQRMVEQEQALKTAKQTAAQQAEMRRRAEAEAKAAYDNLTSAMALAEETEERLAAEQARFEERLGALQAQTTAAPAARLAVLVGRAQQAGDSLDLDEADTRKLIDRQLRDADWEADTQEMTFGKGARPQKGRNLAIAEWPTASGPADYVLFVGLTPVAVVEAKRKRKDVAGAIEQSKRYSRDYRDVASEIMPGGPWGKYRIPFLFATNGRPYLKQIRTKSGIWFLDARENTNHPRALEGWYSPAGLMGSLKQDITAADEELQDEPTDYLPLRDYQHEAVRAVERAVATGRRDLLLAMATGTGKTRTAIGIMYRLIKAKRFRRILFLVDRTALGEQATNAFKDVKLENYQAFTDIYDVKELSDMVPDSDTKLQVATIQGMVKRLLYPNDNTEPLPVDTYDCVVVDECHRGYNLDREMTDAELTFRSEQDYISKYVRVLDHFDAVKIGMTATPAIHTTNIFGGPDRKAIYQYSYRQAVIDGWLVDHEPPVRIVTALAEDGMHWGKGEQMKVLPPGKTQLTLFELPDDVDIEIDEFNKRVVTENFNRVVCEELVKHIDPSLPGKTLIFCVTDFHADMVVDLLKQAFDDHYGPIDDDAVKKITGAADKPGELIRRYKNEGLPKVAVTVDLLTTGIDVPEIANLVFIRRVRSRILYEQMLGRATRLCPDLHAPGEDKQHFTVFDAADIYSILKPLSDMKPVVTTPNISFAQLVDELNQLTDEPALREVHDQLLAKLQRKRRSLSGKGGEDFVTLAGMEPNALIEQIKHATPKQTATWFNDKPELVTFLDRAGGPGQPLIVSEHPDEIREVGHGYGKAKRPDDYLESFRTYVQDNLDQIEALQVVTQRPRDLTRQQLRELKLLLDKDGYSETNLRTAYRETTNQDFAATIIGYVRHVALGAPLMPYEDRVRHAMQTIMTSRSWTGPQRKWLDRIGKQLLKETVVDHQALDHGQFRQYGGFTRLNKVFDGKLDELLREIVDNIWQAAA